MMDCYKFIMTLEGIATGNDLRLIMNRAGCGCDIFFYFRDDLSGEYSESITWFNGKEEPESLFNRLSTLAADFKSKLINREVTE
jgi:hypothetical protein